MSGAKKRNEADLILGVEDSLYASAAQGLHLLHRLEEAQRRDAPVALPAAEAGGAGGLSAGGTTSGDLLFDLLRLHVEMQEKRIELGFRFVDGIFDLLQRSSRGRDPGTPLSKLCLSGTTDQASITGTFSLMNATAEPLQVSVAVHPFEQDGKPVAGGGGACTLSPAAAQIAPRSQLEVTAQVSPGALPGAGVYRTILDVQRGAGGLRSHLSLEVRLSPPVIVGGGSSA